MDDLNFFNPQSKLFHYDAALYSAGVASNPSNPPPCMVTTRQSGSGHDGFILGDSSGYQIATGAIQMSPQKRRDIYNWLTKHCDLSMTLDTPTGPMYRGKAGYYPSFNECLFATFGHLVAFESFGASKHPFLNVLQGEGFADCTEWYESVRFFDSYGLAIAGGTKNPLPVQLWRILDLIEDGVFDDREETWLHFLGVADLKTALLLSVVRKALNERFPQCLTEVSYDTSTPFFCASKLIAVSDYSVSPYSLTVKFTQINKKHWAGNPSPFPYQLSEIAKRISMSDIVHMSARGTPFVSTEGYLLLMNHNLHAIIQIIDYAHKILECGDEPTVMQRMLPIYLLEAQKLIREILAEPDIGKARKMILHRPTLRALSNGYKNVGRI